MNDEPKQNTDRELWRETPEDYYADSIHVTEGGGIGINCGGTVIVRRLRDWHRAVEETKRLYDALVKFGKHAKDCLFDAPLATGDGFWGCDCGFDKALIDLEPMALPATEKEK